jgi:hypothetical protein
MAGDKGVENSSEAGYHAATANGVVARNHVPGRRRPIHGACGKIVLFFTPRPMDLRACTKEITTRFTFSPKNTRTPFATRCSR